MNLEDFPMDTQRCPLKFGSCKYETHFTNLKLKKKKFIKNKTFVKLFEKL